MYQNLCLLLLLNDVQMDTGDHPLSEIFDILREDGAGKSRSCTCVYSSGQ